MQLETRPGDRVAEVRRLTKKDRQPPSSGQYIEPAINPAEWYVFVPTPTDAESYLHDPEISKEHKQHYIWFFTLASVAGIPKDLSVPGHCLRVIHTATEHGLSFTYHQVLALSKHPDEIVRVAIQNHVETFPEDYDMDVLRQLGFVEVGPEAEKIEE